MATMRWTMLICMIAFCVQVVFAQTAWQAVGPRSIPNSHACDNGAEASLLAAGRIQAFAIDLGDPSVMYAGGGVGTGNSGPTSDAGAFKSIDGGTHWTAIDNGLTDRYVDDLWLDQDNPGILLASTFFGGIYRSADGGQTWTNVRPGSTTTLLQVGSTLFAGAADGVASSSDLGQTWTLVHPTSSPVRALGYGAGAMYAGLDDGTVQVQISSNAAWNTCLAGGNGLSIYDVAVNPSNGLEAIVVRWKLGPVENWITQDGGATWSTFSYPAQQSGGTFNCSGGAGKVIAFDSVDSNTIYGGFGGSMWVSKDGGASWTPLHLYEDLNLIYPFPGFSGSMVVGGDQGIYMSQDYGATWSTLNGDLATNLLTDVAVNGSEIFTAVQDFSPAQSFDGGNTWLQLSSSQPPVGEDGVVFINPGNPQYQLVFTGVGLQYSTDGGRTFTNDSKNLPSSEWGFEGTSDYLAVDPGNPQHIYLVGTSGIFESNDYGIHWQATGWPISNPTCIRVAPNDSNTIFIGASSAFSGSASVPAAVYYTHDDGATWNSSNLPAGPWWPVSLDIDPSDSNVILLGVSNPPDQQGGGVLISTDGGQTFTSDSQGLQAYPNDSIPQEHYIYSIRFAPPSLPHLVVAATNNGLYFSRAGRPWVDITGNAIPRWFNAVFWTSDFLYAATYGEGVIRSPLSGLVLQDVTISASPTTAVVGTPIAFTAQVSGGTAPYGYAWTFGDGTTSNAASPSHSYSQPGHYTVSVTVTDAAGAIVTSAPVSVTITPVPPQIASISHAGPPFRLIVMGSHFESGATATIGTTPWSELLVKSSTKLVIKGGKGLKALLPLRQTVSIVITNPDGGASAAYLFTR